MNDVVEADPLKELTAMKSLHEALLPLSPDGRGRVIAWAIGALDVRMSVKKPDAGGRVIDRNTYTDDDHGDDSGAPNQKAGKFEQFADLLGEAEAQTDADKALVGGYWFQVIEGAGDFTSQGVNDKLKDTGEAIGNITRAMERLKATKPQLVRQLIKGGKSQQARKKFKLTTAGIQAVEKMLKGEG